MVEQPQILQVKLAILDIAKEIAASSDVNDTVNNYNILHSLIFKSNG